MAINAGRPYRDEEPEPQPALVNPSYGAPPEGKYDWDYDAEGNVRVNAPPETDPNVDWWAHRAAYNEPINSQADQSLQQSSGANFSYIEHMMRQYSIPGYGEEVPIQPSMFSQVEHGMQQKEREWLKPTEDLVPNLSEIAKKTGFVPTDKTWLQQLWDGANIQTNKAYDYLHELLFQPAEGPGKAWPGFKRAANILFGSPIAWPTAVPKDIPARGAVWNTLTQGPSLALRRITGFTHYLGTLPPIPGASVPKLLRSDATDIKTATAVYQLNQGIYGTAYRDFVENVPGLSPQELETEYKMADELQQVWTARYNELVGVSKQPEKQEKLLIFPLKKEVPQLHGPGWSAPDTMNETEAFAQVWKEYRDGTGVFTKFTQLGTDTRKDATENWLEQVKRNLPEAVAAFSQGKRTLPWSQPVEEAWQKAAGFGYTHLLKGDAEKLYDKLLDSGMDPVQAGIETQDQTIEMVATAIFDPNWYLNLDNLAVKMAVKPVSFLLKGAVSVLGKVPVLKGGVEWMLAINAKTIANKATMATEEAINATARELRRTGVEVTADNITAFIKKPTVEFLTNEGGYYARAVGNTADNIDEVQKVLKEAFDPKTLAPKLAGKTADEARVIMDKVIHDAAKDSAMKVYASSISKTAAASKWKAIWTNSTLLKAANNVLMKPLAGANGIAVDMWLGLRPAWNVFNFVDNTVKLLLDGIEPFQSLPNMLKRYAGYGVGGVLDEASLATISNPKHIFSIANNKAMNEALERVGAPLGSVGSLAKGESKGGSLLRWVSGAGKTDRGLVAWTFSLGERTEGTFGLRAYLHNFEKAVDAKWAVIEKEGVYADVLLGGLPGKVNATSKVNDAVMQRLNALPAKTPSAIRSFFADLLDTNKITLSNVRGVSSLRVLPTEIVSDMVKKFDDLSMGTRPYVTVQEVAKVFDDGARQVGEDYVASIKRGVAAFDETLAHVPKDADDMLDMLLRGKKVEQASMDEVLQGLDDIHLVAQRMNVENVKLTAEWKTVWNKAIADKLSKVEIDALADNFLNANGTRQTMFKKFAGEEQEAFTRLADRADELMGTSGSTIIPGRPKITLRPGTSPTVDVFERTPALGKGKVYRVDTVTTLPKGTSVGDTIRYEASLGKTVNVDPEWMSILDKTDANDAVWVYKTDVEAANEAAKRGVRAVSTPTVMSSYRVIAEDGAGGYLVLKQTPQQVWATVDAMPIPPVNPKAFPRENIKRFMDAVTNLQTLENETRLEKTRIRILRWSKQTKEVKQAGIKLDKKWAKLKPKYQDEMYQATVGIRDWSIKNGLAVETFDPAILDKNAGWWVLGQKINNIPDSAMKAMDEQLTELRTWKAAVMKNRTRMFETVHLNATDRSIVESYGKGLVTKSQTLVTDSIDEALKERNRLLFDYSTTPNWMETLGKIVPFVRYPSKNIPLWAEMFQKVPHLLGSIMAVRSLQAHINRDLPAKNRYSIPIPRGMTDWALEGLGMHSTQLYVNPWSYISLFQQLPGGTPFKQTELSSFLQTDEDASVANGFRALSTFTKQLGFGNWPYIEWTLGLTGVYGPDWYPRDVMGTFTPYVDYAMKEAFGYDKNFDIDKLMRQHVPWFLNYVFQNTPFEFDTLNPEMMTKWAQGAEVEGIITTMPDEAAMQLLDITPSQSLELTTAANKLDPVALGMMRKEMQGFFSLPPELQVEGVQKMDPLQKAVLFEEANRIALRNQVRKRALFSLIGNVSGVYTDPVMDATNEARDMRMQKRMIQSGAPPGPETREAVQQFMRENPQYELNQVWRFNQFPWTETAAKTESAKWDSMVSDRQSEWYDYDAIWDKELGKAKDEYIRAHPGDSQGLWDLINDFSAQRKTKKGEIESKLTADINAGFLDYMRRYPFDKTGKKLLEDGFDMPVYETPQFNEAELAELEQYKRIHPGDEKGYKDKFTTMWNELTARTPQNKTKKWPGMKNGFTIDLDFNPRNYSDEENLNFTKGSVFKEVKAGAPKYEDFTSGTEYHKARLAWMDAFQDNAMATATAQKQVKMLVDEQKKDRSEALEIVKAWYTEEEYGNYLERFSSPLEALNDAYADKYIVDANDEWYNKVVIEKDRNPDLYQALKEGLFQEYGPKPATDFISYVMEEFPGKWTQIELERLYAGITMPSYADKKLLGYKGDAAMNGQIWARYNLLTVEQKKSARDAFGDQFTNVFLKSNAENPIADTLTLNLRGGWLNALGTLTGKPIDWTTLPGMDAATVKNGGKGEAIAVGLPNVDIVDEVEYNKASKINSLYWQRKAAGDESYKELEKDPLRLKYFGGSGSNSKSYFWDFYKTHIPPGWAAKQLKQNPILQQLLDPNIRNVIASDSDYDKAVDLMQSWLIFNSKVFQELGYDEDEYGQIGELWDAYFSIPAEDKAARKSFWNANPLLEKYNTEPKGLKSQGEYLGAGAGGGGTSKPYVPYAKKPFVPYASRGGGASFSSGGSATNYAQEWSNFRSSLGASYVPTMRVLSRYWGTGKMGPATKKYLQKLYDKLKIKIPFEKWLKNLQTSYAYQAGKTGGWYVPKEARTPIRHQSQQGTVSGRRRI